MDNKHYSEYLSPECRSIALEISGLILIGSNEGGGGNESYAPMLNSFDEFDPIDFPF